MPTILISEAAIPNGRSFRVNDLDPQSPPITAQEDARRPFAIAFPNDDTALEGAKIVARQLRARDTRHGLVLPQKQHGKAANFYVPALSNRDLPYITLYPLPVCKKWITQSEYRARQHALQKAKEYLLRNEPSLPVFPEFPSTPLVVISADDLGQRDGLCLDAKAWDELNKAEGPQQTFSEVVLSRRSLAVFHGYDEDMEQFFRLPNHIIIAYAIKRDFNDLADAAAHYDPSDAGLYLEAAKNLQILDISTDSIAQPVETMLDEAHQWCAMNQLRPSHKARTHWIQGVLERANRDNSKRYMVPRIEPPIFSETTAHVQTASRHDGVVRLVVGSCDHEFIHGTTLVEDFHALLKGKRHPIPNDLMFNVVAANGQSFFYKKYEQHSLLRKKLKEVARKSLYEKDIIRKAMQDAEQGKREKAEKEGMITALSAAEEARLEYLKEMQLKQQKALEYVNYTTTPDE